MTFVGGGRGWGNKNLVGRESTGVDFSRWAEGGGEGGEEISGWWGGGADSPTSITLISVA